MTKTRKVRFEKYQRITRGRGRRQMHHNRIGIPFTMGFLQTLKEYTLSLAGDNYNVTIAR